MKRPAIRSAVLFLAALIASSCKPVNPSLQGRPAGASPAPFTASGITKRGLDRLEETPSVTPVLPPLTETVPVLNRPEEQPVIEIPLAGPAAGEKAEFSGLAWYGEMLVLLPQFPERMSGRGQPGVLFALPEASLLAFLEGESVEPLILEEIPLISPDLQEIIPNFEGFEALAFSGDRVYLTIESGRLGPMMSYIIAGQVEPGLREIQLDIHTLHNIQPQADLINRGEEALVFAGDRLLSLFETNGTEIVPHPIAHQIDLETFEISTIPFTNIKYRITDATPMDDFGRFWVLNTYFPGDFFIYPDTDPIADQFGEGATHSTELAVERLLQLQLDKDGITLAETPPIQLQLLDSFQGRNWEGLAELRGRGFVLITDEHPQTILAFVPYP